MCAGAAGADLSPYLGPKPFFFPAMPRGEDCPKFESLRSSSHGSLSMNHSKCAKLTLQLSNLAGSLPVVAVYFVDSLVWENIHKSRIRCALNSGATHRINQTKDVTSSMVATYCRQLVIAHKPSQIKR